MIVPLLVLHLIDGPLFISYIILDVKDSSGRSSLHLKVPTKFLHATFHIRFNRYDLAYYRVPRFLNFFDISFSLITRLYPSWFKCNSKLRRGSSAQAFFLVAEIYMILSVLCYAKEVIFLLIFFNKVKIRHSPVIVYGTFILFSSWA